MGLDRILPRIARRAAPGLRRWAVWRHRRQGTPAAHLRPLGFRRRTDDDGPGRTHGMDVLRTRQRREYQESHRRQQRRPQDGALELSRQPVPQGTLHHLLRTGMAARQEPRDVHPGRHRHQQHRRQRLERRPHHRTHKGGQAVHPGRQPQHFGRPDKRQCRLPRHR